MRVLIASTLLLAGCALTGLEGPERQAKAQEALDRLTTRGGRDAEGVSDNEYRRAVHDQEWDAMETRQRLDQISARQQGLIP
jgi:hypothetical protein